MKNNPTNDALIKRINRKLQPNQKLKVTPRHKLRSLGAFHIINTLTGMATDIIKSQVDLELLGATLGVKPIAEVKATTV